MQLIDKNYYILPFLSLFFCSCNTNNQQDNLFAVSTNESSKAHKVIANPLELEYDFLEISKLDDGSSANTYMEKGKSNSKDGEYAWSKMVPFYASAEIQYVFEYQMYFTDHDFDALSQWIVNTMGTNTRIGSLDKPNWYHKNMKLSEVYSYCKTNNKNITMILYNKPEKKMATIIFDSGSNKTKTMAEIGLLLTVFN